MAGPVLIPAASVLLLRDFPLEVLMILRHENSSFVPSVWVFPGGALDGGETAHDAAVREVFEETAVQLTGELVPTSRWITPEGLPKRFDTLFFLTAVPRDVPVTLQEEEAVQSCWISPAGALARQIAGEMPMVFPTIRNLEAIAGASSTAELIASRRGALIEPVQPVMIVADGRRRIVLP